jgi:hypothetical protein
LLLFQCSLFEKDKEKEKETRNKLILGLFFLNSQRQSGVDFNCNTSPSPKSFAEFQSALDNFNTSSTKCSGCHGNDTATANFIITNYNSVDERADAGNPGNSLLYFKVKPTGTMAPYTNPNINKTIYCYILNGLNR